MGEPGVRHELAIASGVINSFSKQQETRCFGVIEDKNNSWDEGKLMVDVYLFIEFFVLRDEGVNISQAF